MGYFVYLVITLVTGKVQLSDVIFGIMTHQIIYAVKRFITNCTMVFSPLVIFFIIYSENSIRYVVGLFMEFLQQWVKITTNFWPKLNKMNTLQ